MCAVCRFCLERLHIVPFEVRLRERLLFCAVCDYLFLCALVRWDDET